MTKASVIIPAYNAERFIEAALASACAQSEADLEILFVDDGRCDARFHLVNTPHSGGPFSGRNGNETFASNRLVEPQRGRSR